MTLGETLKLLSPELLLLITGLVVLIADMIWRDEAAKTLWMPGLALGGLALALAATLWLWQTPPTTVLAMMAVDPFALFFKVIAIGTVALVILAATPYLQGRTPYRGEFYALLVFAGLAIALASSATNLISIYLSMEFLSITSYILAGYLRDDIKSSEAGLKYFLYGAVTSAIMLYGMSLLYGISGTTSLSGIARFVAAGDPTSQWLATASIVLLLAGFGFKIVLAPFHQWAPDTYEGAPTPMTAFLSVGSKAAGFAILMRVFLTALPAFRWDIGWMAFLMALSIISMALGNLIALRQTNVKRMLAYSSIAQAGYIIIGFICLTMNVQSSFLGINGTLFYLFAYLFTNLAVFAGVIAFESATGSTEISDMRGLIKRSPLIAGVMFLGLLSLAGIPGTGGFLGKLAVFGSAIQFNTPQTLALAIVGIVTSAIAAYYYLNVVRWMFFEPAEEGAPDIAVPVGQKVGLLLAGIAVLVVGIYPQPFIEFATRSIQMVAMAF
ncbi:MAG: NADH-quinone oxidoreductase subunit N [Anaerolineaceae bacterium]|nr:NADH-quinone oxidoreductase subunit N [Anaerolineaceae bacterium]